jgi:hypothetical protein
MIRKATPEDGDAVAPLLVQALPGSLRDRIIMKMLFRW